MSASITVRVPVTIRKRGGRRLVVAPDGAPWSPPKARIDNTLVKALARAHRWKKMLAPDIVEAILDGRQPAELRVHVLRAGFPVLLFGR